MERWYLVHTKPSRERQVAVQFNQRGIGVYLPLIWVNPVNSRTAREQPYFPSHLFAKLDPGSVAVDVIRWAPGVRGLVECCGEPVFVSDDFVVVLQQCLTRVRARAGTGLDAARGADFLPMSHGPFEGYEGIFNPRVSAVNRARILLACVEQEFWRQTTEGRPAARRPDAPAAPRPGS